MELATLSTFDAVFPGMSPQDVALNSAQAFRSRERAWILGLRLFMHTTFIQNRHKDSCYLHKSQVYESRSFITTSRETKIHGSSGTRCHGVTEFISWSRFQGSRWTCPNSSFPVAGWFALRNDKCGDLFKDFIQPPRMNRRRLSLMPLHVKVFLSKRNTSQLVCSGWLAQINYHFGNQKGGWDHVSGRIFQWSHHFESWAIPINLLQLRFNSCHQ